MSYSANIMQARKDADDVIKQFPHIKDDVEETFELFMCGVNEGESPDNEVEHFYSYLQELIHP